MDKKIQELTDKIYKEGVEKGNEQAQQIVAYAQAKAQQIEADAQKKANDIIADAHKQAEEQKKNTESEIKLYAGQALEALKSEVANLVTNKLSADAVNAAFPDKEFMQQIILELVSEWSKSENLVIEGEDAAGLTKYFEAKAKTLLDKSVKIEQVNGMKSDFTIAPANGAYKITFGETEFVNYFKNFLRPQLVELLFSK